MATSAGEGVNYGTTMVNRIGSKAGGQWWDYLIGALQGVGDILIDKYEMDPQREEQARLAKRAQSGGIYQNTRSLPRMSR